MIEPQPEDATSTTDEVIATQRGCYKEISWYKKNLKQPALGSQKK